MKSKSILKKEQTERALEIANFASRFDLFCKLDITLSSGTLPENYPEFEQDLKNFRVRLQQYAFVKELLG